MKDAHNNPISRRSMMQAAAVLAGALTGAMAVDEGAFASSNAPETATSRDRPRLTTLINLEGVRREYRDAVSTFPLALPEGWSFPPESSAREAASPLAPTASSLWESGSGHVEVYMYWLRAVASAACDAHAGGNDQIASRLLDDLETGYSTSERRMAILDPANQLLGLVVDPARGGGSTARHSVDFTNLMSIARS